MTAAAQPPRPAPARRSQAALLHVAGALACLLLLPPVLLMLAWSANACTEHECTTYWGGAMVMLVVALALCAAIFLQLRGLVRLLRPRGASAGE